MGTHRIHKVEPLGSHQVVIWLEDNDGRTEDAKGLSMCVQLSADAIAPLIHELTDAHMDVLGRVMLELAAGGCRTCNNTRMVGVNHLAALFHGDGGGEPCPVCVPRAEERIRRAAHLPPRKP
jgi:hypothetical protein